MVPMIMKSHARLVSQNGYDSSRSDHPSHWPRPIPRSMEAASDAGWENGRRVSLDHCSGQSLSGIKSDWVSLERGLSW